jgi:hypothetical protein
MATFIIPSLRSALERLKHAGSTNGLCLAWRRQVLINLLPYEDFRAEKLIHALRDAREHFAGGGRNVETFWYGFEGVHLLATFRGDCLLVVLHTTAAEVEFLASASTTFLNDAQLLVDAMLNPPATGADEQATQRLRFTESEATPEPIYTPV